MERLASHVSSRRACAFAAHLVLALTLVVSPRLIFGQDAGAPRLPALQSHVVTLTGARFQGRETGTAGERAAAQYLASALAAAGAAAWPVTADGESGGSAAYIQPFTLQERAADVELRLEPQSGGGGALTTYTSDEAVHALLRGAQQLEHRPIVFAGFGIRDAQRQYDDLAGVTLTDSVALILNNAASATVRDDFFLDPAVSRRYFGASSELTRFRQLREAGAKAILVLQDPWTVSRDSGPRRQSVDLRRLGLPGTSGTSELLAGIVGIPVVRISPTVASALLAEDGVDPLQLADTLHRTGRAASRLARSRLSLRVTPRDVAVPAENVIGLVVGTDQTLREEFVVIGAHYDHLGLHGERMWPGADDNAAGTAAVLEVARSLAASPPKRSVIIAFWSGEEEGLLGSEQFAARLQRERSRVVAAVNLDMVGRPQPAALASAPRGLHVVSSRGIDLARALPRPAAYPALDLLLNRRPSEGIRSDQLSFAAHGFENIVLHHGWEHPDYHQPGDTADRIDYPYLGDVAALARDLVVALAN